MKLKDVAHIRTGDKGNDSNIAVIPYDEADYEMLRERLTVELVRDFYHDFCGGRVIRYDVPGIKALNFVLEDSLGGGVTLSLALDRNGKGRGMALGELSL